ncbi:MAG TPA: endolytic transglycosylase MltG [Solirubrobacteraceae bacterium]|nr:endolytic transglycosylase MltG [Solirubrobacteraceae bacterium]
MALLVALGAIWFLVELFQPLHGAGHGRVRVRIPKSAGASQIGQILAHDGVVSSAFFFKLRAALAGDRDKLLAGTYEIPLGVSYSQALTILTTPPKSAPVRDVTIIDGLARAQIDALLRHERVHGSYLADTRRSKLLDPRRYGAPKHTPSLEGFLYPDTYQLREPLRIPALVADQLKRFKQEFAKVSFAYARSKHLTPYDVLIIASLVEAEARTAHDRALAASVIYNRLADGMDLGLDTTAAYAADNYSGSLTQAQLNSRSPWNTLNHKGLPPTPIDSPSLASIEAAAHPPRTGYLYFIVKVCGNGSLAFTSNYQQFLADSQAYQEALHKHGQQRTEFCAKRHG